MSETHDLLLKKYLQLPERLENAIAGLEEAGLDLKSSGWTIRQYVHHLVEGELIWEVNLRAAAGSDGIALPMNWYFTQPQDIWVERWAYDRRPIGPALALFHASTCDLVGFLRSVPAQVWKHSGRITWPGEPQESSLTVRDILVMHLRHMDGHTADIRAIRDLHGC